MLDTLYAMAVAHPNCAVGIIVTVMFVIAYLPSLRSYVSKAE